MRAAPALFLALLIGIGARHALGADWLAPAGAARAVDGDTFDLSAELCPGSAPIHFRRPDIAYCRIRLRGVDTPERGAAGFAEAGAELQRRLDSGAATIERRAIDAYRRVVAVVTIGGVDIGQDMKRQGWGKKRR